MIDLGRETDGNNEICLGVHFALCMILTFMHLIIINIIIHIYFERMAR